MLRQGQIMIGRKIIYCAVHDMSAAGARLEVGVALPQAFELLVVGHPSPLHANLKWRTGNYAGIAFREHLTEVDLDAIRTRQRLAPQTR